MIINTKHKIYWIIAFFSLIIVIFFGIRSYYSERICFTDFGVIDPVIKEKKQDGPYKQISFYCDPQNCNFYDYPDSFENFFSFPKDIQIDSLGVYDALVPGVRYQSFSIKVCVTYEEAIENDLFLTKEEFESIYSGPYYENTLNLRKILNSALYIQRYCHLEAAYAYDYNEPTSEPDIITPEYLMP